MVHVLGWAMQLGPGHAWSEKRKPALADSLLQSLLLAPLFVWMEVLFVAGYRPALHAAVQERVQQQLAKWRREEEAGAAQKNK